MALGPLKELDEGRRGRTVRALAYYPSLPATPWHDPTSFPWLEDLQANRGMMLEVGQPSAKRIERCLQLRG